ncbi:MAG: ABC transporter permease [Rhizobiales bacterium]|nr:ABC transporter permease [Hyphomicrobiales bacterium]
MPTKAGSLELLSQWGGNLLVGALSTIQISLWAYAFGLCLGLLGAVGKLNGGRVARGILDGYTTIVRSVPELVLIVILYYAGTDTLNRVLAHFGFDAVRISGFMAAVFVLAFVQGAYSTEVLRGAIQAIPIGQIEAARAFGMAPVLRFRRIILPAMLPYAIPGLANLWLNVTKDSALVAVVGYSELALATRQAAGGTKAYFLFYVVAAGIYLTISIVSLFFFGRLERRFRRGQHKAR